MRNSEAYNLIRMFGGRDALAQTLNITHLSEELQLEILARFSENIFKHILIHVPREHTARIIDVLDAHAEDGDDFEDLIIVLDQHIPNREASLRKEVQRTIAQFRLEGEGFLRNQ